MAQLKDLSVEFLSLVRSPATGKGLTLKSETPNSRVNPFELTVKSDELMRAYGIVYAPDQTDAHGDSADAVTIRRAQAEFMREGRLKNIDTEHSFTPEMAFVAESWLVRKGDALFADEPEGAWAVGIQIGDPDLWKELKSGDLTGISLAGVARVDPPPAPGHPSYTEKDAVPGWFKRLFNSHNKADEETDMQKDDVEKIVRDTLKSELGAAVAEAMKSAGVAPAKVPDDPPPSGGDGTEIEKAIAKAFASIEGKIDDKITVALAKGASEADPGHGSIEESFA